MEFGLVSFNFGIDQGMLESAKRWCGRHVFRFRELLTKLGPAAGNDFVLGSEVGASRMGFKAVNMDFQHIVQDALPGAAGSTRGAYFHVWNVRAPAAAVVESGTWTAKTAHATDVHWQAYDLTYRDASQLADRDAPQLADSKVGLVVGNMHIPAGSKRPTMCTRRRIVDQALKHLTHLNVGIWRDRRNFPVMRLLVGDCNLSKDEAEAATQKLPEPRLTALQQDFELRRWQVCDVPFPRQALQLARTPST